jgi:hypothetical protein
MCIVFIHSEAVFRIRSNLSFTEEFATISTLYRRGTLDWCLNSVLLLHVDIECLATLSSIAEGLVWSSQFFFKYHLKLNDRLKELVLESVFHKKEWSHQYLVLRRYQSYYVKTN